MAKYPQNILLHTFIRFENWPALATTSPKVDGGSATDDKTDVISHRTVRSFIANILSYIFKFIRNARFYMKKYVLLISLNSQ